MTRHLFSKGALAVPPLLFACVLAAAQPSPQVMGLHAIDEGAGVDEEMAALLAPYREGVDELREPIATAEDTMLFINRDWELGAWVTDRLRGYLTREIGEPVDMVVMNAGGVRNTLAEGDVSALTIMQILPFENTLAAFELTGGELLELGRFLASRRGWNPVSGARISHGPEGEFIEMTLTGPEGEPVGIDPEGSYLVGTISFLADGAAGFDFFGEREYRHIDLPVRDAVTEEVRRMTARGEPIVAPPDLPRYTLIEPEGTAAGEDGS